MRKGDLPFVLHGTRLNGRFHLVRLNRRERSRQDAWFLIKGHDEHERPGIDALALENEVPPPAPPAQETGGRAKRPAAGAVRGALPREQAPELASIAEAPPEGEGWVSEIKFDGYRLLASLDHVLWRGRIHARSRLRARACIKRRFSAGGHRSEAQAPLPTVLNQTFGSAATGPPFTRPTRSAFAT